MSFGMNDLRSVVRIPSTWDLAYMKQWQTADGVTWDRVITRLGAAMLMFNQSLTTNKWAPFYRTTTEMAVEYGVGQESGELPLLTEHNRQDLFTGDFTGHMIPMRDYGGGLGWTEMALRRGSSAKLDLSMGTLIQRSETTWSKRLMERMFSNAAVRVGAAGVSVPFADGGSADDAYVPPSFEGKDFTNTHNHYFRKSDDEAGRSAALVDMSETLREHGLMGPYVCVIPETDVALWTAQPEYVKPDRAAFLTAGLEVRGIMPDPESFIGLWETDRSWGYFMPNTRLSANYAGMYKLFGHNNAFAPLVVRYESGFPLGLSISGQIIQYPLQEAQAMLTFGVGTNQRTNGTCTYFAGAGDYVDPVIA